MATEPTTSQSPSIIDRLLRLFSDVRGGEGFTALLLMSNLFLLLTAYLIIKVVREALILGEGGAVVKSYASAGGSLPPRHVTLTDWWQGTRGPSWHSAQAGPLLETLVTSG